MYRCVQVCACTFNPLALFHFVEGLTACVVMFHYLLCTFNVSKLKGLVHQLEIICFFLMIDRVSILRKLKKNKDKHVINYYIILLEIVQK